MAMDDPFADIGQQSVPKQVANPQQESVDKDPFGDIGITQTLPKGVEKFMEGVGALNAQYEKNQLGIQSLPFKSPSQVIGGAIKDYVLGTPQVVEPILKDKVPELPASPSQQIRKTVGALGRGIEAGMAPLGAGLAQALTPEDSVFGKQIRRTQEAREAELGALMKESPITGGLGYLTGAIGSGMAIPGGLSSLGAKTARGALMTRMGTGALGGAAFAGALYDSTPEEMKFGAAVGAAAPAVAGLLRSSKRILFPGEEAGKLSAAQKIKEAAKAKGMVGEAGDINSPAMKAAQQEGIFLSPEEAMKTKALVGELGTMTPTGIERYPIEQMKLNREALVLGKTRKIATDLVPEGTKADKIASALFEESRKTPIPAGLLDDLKMRPEYQNAFKLVQEANPGLNPNTIGFQHQIYRQLNFTKQQLLRSGEAISVDAIPNLSRTRKALGELMGNVDPRFQKGVDLYKRMSIQNEILHMIENRAAKKGLETLDANQLKSILVGKETNKKELYKLISQAGGNPKQADNVIEILGAMDHGLILNALINKKSHVARGPIGRLMDEVMGKLGGPEKMQAGMVELITNPKWANEVTRIIDTQNATRSSELLLKLLGRVSTDLFIKD